MKKRIIIKDLSFIKFIEIKLILCYVETFSFSNMKLLLTL